MESSPDPMERLYQGALARDERALETLRQEWVRRVSERLRYRYGRVLGPSTLEEIAEDAFSATAIRFIGFPRADDALRYMTTVALNSTRRRLQRSRLFVRLGNEDVWSESDLERGSVGIELRDDLRTFPCTLDAKDLLTFVLRCKSDISWSTLDVVTRVLRESPRTVKRRSARLSKRFRSFLEARS